MNAVLRPVPSGGRLAAPGYLPGVPATSVLWNWWGLYKKTGSAARGRVEAANEADARALAAASAPEAVIVGVRRSSALASQRNEQSFRARRGDTARLFRGVATSVEAGLSVREALEMEREESDEDGSSAAPLAADLYDRVLAGETFAEALKRHSSTLGPVPSAVVEAGDSSGTLPAMLDGLAGMLERSHEIRSKLRSVMIYPAFSLFVVLSVAAAGILYVVPNFVELLTATAEDPSLPQPTAAMVGLSDTVRARWWLFGAAGVVGGVGIGTALSRPAVRDMLSGAVLALPGGLGSLVRDAATSVICQMLSLLLSAGLESGEAARLTAEAVPQLRMRNRLREVEVSVLRGIKLPEALGAVTPPMDRRLQHLARLSAKVANPGEPWRRYGIRLESETGRRMETVQQMIQPVLTLALGAVLITVGLGITRPLLKVYEGF